MSSVIDILNNKFPNSKKIAEEISNWNIEEQIYKGNPAQGWETGSIYVYENTIVRHHTIRDIACIPCFRTTLLLPKKVLAAVSVNVYHNAFANTKLYFIKHQGDNNFNKDTTFEMSFVHSGTTQHAFAVIPFQKIDIYIDGPKQTFRHITLIITILDILEDDN